jgi:hypothetical protein
MHVSEEGAVRTAGSHRSALAGDRIPVRERPAGGGAGTVLMLLALTVLGAALRLSVAGQSLFADELSTYWILDTNGLWGVVSTVHTDAEITPPLFFVLSWLTTRVELTPELLRAPSLLAGVATIPLVYLIGVRTVGRAAALVAAALSALAPFMIFYSAEGRGYGLAIGLVTLSTLALLAATDEGRVGWWVVYAAASCAAMYTHYTVAFVLAAQLLWLLWARPEARGAALLANAGAAIGFLPWLSGLGADLDSPTTDILSSLAPVTADSVASGLAHWSIGYPYLYPSTGLTDLPGPAALVLLGLGVALAGVGLALRVSHRVRPPRLDLVDRRLVLVVALALATPVGALLTSAIGTNVFGVRNLAASWPGLALALAAFLVAAGPRLRIAAVALTLASFAIGAVRMLDDGFQRPNYRGAAALIDRAAAPGDPVIDAAVASPGPLSGVDVALDEPHPLFRVGAPQERGHPFTVIDRVQPAKSVARQAAAAADGRPIFVVSGATASEGRPADTDLARKVAGGLPERYRRVRARTYPGILDVSVLVYASGESSRR